MGHRPRFRDGWPRREPEACPLEAIGGDYGLRYPRATAMAPDRSGYPSLHVFPLEDAGGLEFAVVCPDGVVIHFVAREVVDGYVDLCQCGHDVHYDDNAPRNPVPCWIDVLPDGWDRSARFGLYIEGWGWPFEWGDEVEQLVAFAIEHRYPRPEVRVPRRGRHATRKRSRKC